jgi:ABC-type transport system involved in cytochrome c biogenesis permease subunit
MSVIVLRFAALFYAGATAAYIIYFARPKHPRLSTAGAALLAIAFVIHGAAIGIGCAEFGGAEFFTLRGGLVLVVWLGAGAYLLLQRFYHLPSLGAFITPFILVTLIPALFGRPGHPELPPETVRHPTLTIHIITAGLGVALFGIAFGAAIMYLLQEREVKGKRFGALFLRLPSLDTLDRMVQRLVRLGFVVYTVALVAGTLTATAVWKSAWSWDPQQVVSMAVWLLYGGLVQARHSGWHGRRYALLTLVGFVVVLGSMVTLKVVPGITRHAGDYGTGVSQGAAQ